MSKQEGKFSSMDSLVSGFALDPAKCNKLSLEEKRKLVHKIAQWSEDAPRVLSSLTRGELLEIICAEMGKERKYSGYTKSRMIDHLLKLVYRNSMKKTTGDSLAFSPTEIEPVPKRQKKQGQPIQQATGVDHASSENIKEEAQFLLCQNLACRAILSPEDGFCKRCSCCICYQYDDNKDPSLWLTCESDSPLEGNLCGMSCHLKCALEHERAGILKNGSHLKLDGSFYCVCCGKNNGLMRSWKRQLLVAKEARRVDVLCLRISLSCKILARTKQYEALQKIVQTASKKLENEVGPLNQACTKMDRGIVNRLSCGAEIQKLCISAVEAFDSIFSDPCYPRVDEDKPPTLRISFEELSPTTVTVVLEYDNHLLEECLGCKLWHRKSTTKDYPKGATYHVMKPRKRFKLADLSPSTEYSCKVTLFSDTQTLGVWEATWVTPASSKRFISLYGNEEHSLIVTPHPNKSVVPKQFAELQSLNCLNKHDESLVLPNVPFWGSASDPPSTPCKSDKRTEVSGLSGKKRPDKSDYKYSVHVIKWLEHEGHIERDFRVKFLTWFSLKAAVRDRRVVSVFIDTMIDDPLSLAGQLIDTFSDEICSDHKPVSRPRFCTRFWH